ncbi:MAG: YHS domain-containing protein [Candidatus Sumerlaeota bacterium]|nr:YHS domain-containing protein [Candidatus Sumerlaeota bacterium]
MSRTRKSLIVLAAFLLVTLFAVTVMAQTRTTRRPRRTREPGASAQGVKAGETKSHDKATTATLPMGEKGKKEGEVKGKTHGTTMRKQTRCPVDNTRVDKKIFTDQNGKRVYFCCSDCKKEFEKNPDKYMKQMKEKGIELGKTPPAEGK